MTHKRIRIGMPDFASVATTASASLRAAIASMGYRFLRLVTIVRVVSRDVTEGRLTLQAMSLVYTTLLSLVPLLAVSFSVLKGFGVHNQIEPLLLKFLAPLGEKSAEITDRIVAFVDNVKVGVLGVVGLGFLIFTVFSLMQKIEAAFNDTWRVRHPRSFAQRFSGYLSVLTIGPVMIVAAIGLTATLTSAELVQMALVRFHLTDLATTLGRFVPYLLVIGAFTFIYIVVPNTHVRLGSALVGAVIAGMLWETVGWGFTTFVVASTNYTAIYSGLAVMILFMVWLYLSWLILLTGASVSFYHQHPQYLRRIRPGIRAGAHEEQILLVITMLARQHYTDTSAWTLEGLAKSSQLPVETVGLILGALIQTKLVVQSDDSPPRFVVARELEGVSVQDLMQAIDTAEPAWELSDEQRSKYPELVALINELTRARNAITSQCSLKDLAGAKSPPLHGARRES